MERVSFHDADAVVAFLRRAKLNPALYRDMVRVWYRERGTVAAVAELLPEAFRESFRGEFFDRSMSLRGGAHAADSPRAPGNSATKALFATHDGELVESVILRHESGRNTLCVSCQVGCAMACVFCATGRLGFRRNLMFHEILEQVDWAVRQLATEGRELRNVVFMGMGEPLLNVRQVWAALGMIQTQSKYNIAPSRISVSTCGVEPEIHRLGQDFPLVKLALSLHAADDALRQRLMPAVRAWPLDRVMAAMDAHAARTGQKIFYEYVMIRDVNDSPDLAAKLVALLAPRAANAHVNLIPYNPDESGAGLSGCEGWESSSRETMDHFQAVLRDAGVASTVRNSVGEGIAAACGQLAAKG